MKKQAQALRSTPFGSFSSASIASFVDDVNSEKLIVNKNTNLNMNADMN